MYRVMIITFLWLFILAAKGFTEETIEYYEVNYDSCPMASEVTIKDVKLSLDSLLQKWNNCVYAVLTEKISVIESRKNIRTEIPIRKLIHHGVYLVTKDSNVFLSVVTEDDTRFVWYGERKWRGISIDTSGFHCGVKKIRKRIGISGTTLPMLGTNEKTQSWLDKNFVTYSIIEKEDCSKKDDRIIASEENMKKLTAGYKSKFGKPITEFERSIIGVSFETGTSDIEQNYKLERVVSLYKRIDYTEDKGAVEKMIAEYSRMYDRRNIELDVSEWLDFINTLYGYRIYEWKAGHYKAPEPSAKDWRLTISFADGEKRLIFGSSGPPNWKKFMKMIDDTEARIKTKNHQEFKQREERINHEVDSLKAEYEKIFELPQTGKFDGNMKNLKTEYKKRFGKPITSFESSIESIQFDELWRHFYFLPKISISRTANGAIARYVYGDTQGIRLDMGEWLDFIKALNECGVSEWNSEYYDTTKGYDQYRKDRWKGWKLYIEFSSKKNGNRYKSSDGSSSDSYPPNWEKFITIMRYIEAKVKENEIKMGRLETEELESIKIEYEKKFKRPITDFELSITSVYFKGGTYYKSRSNYLGLDERIFLTRTANGAVAKYLETKLNVGEWLDFINALREKFHDEWEKNSPKKLSEPLSLDYEYCPRCQEQKLTIFFSDEKKIEYEDNDRPDEDTFGKNMLSKIMDGMLAKIKRKSAGK